MFVLFVLHACGCFFCMGFVGLLLFGVCSTTWVCLFVVVLLRFVDDALSVVVFLLGGGVCSCVRCYVLVCLFGCVCVCLCVFAVNV